ncbi:SPASM domain-containing protein [Chloroflexota bacterium]
MVKSNKGDYFKSAVTLFWNGIKFRYSRLKGAPLKPTVLSLAVTNRCNSHCIMCNIWKRARELPDIKGLEMSKDQIIDLLSRPLCSELVELDLTGGEPHLRDDLVDTVLGISRLKKSSLSRLRSIIIASNGLLHRQIISNYQRILEGLRGTNIDLVSVISIDGIEQTHDLIRGTKGAFELATKTISGLLELRKEYSNYFIGIKTTILPYNINMLGDILDFALEKNLFHIISPVFFTEARFRNVDKREELTVEPAEYKEILKFYSRSELKTSYFYSRTRGFLATGRKQWVCAALYNYLFIDFDGKVYPCEIISEPIGDVKTQDLEDIWNSSLAHYWRSRIGELECCHTCNEPGTIRYSAYTEGFSYLKFLVKLGKHKFSETFYGEGFSKYLGNK